MTRTFFILGSVFGMTAILAGTFGAHGLEQTVTPALLETFDTGVRYHMYHALALIGVAWACEHFGGKLPVEQWQARAEHVRKWLVNDLGEERTVAIEKGSTADIGAAVPLGFIWASLCVSK